MKMDFLILDDIKNEIDKTDSNIQKKRNEVERNEFIKFYFFYIFLFVILEYNPILLILF